MTLVKNGYSHPYTPTIGGVLAPQEVADIGLYAQELDAIAIGRLTVMDPGWTPPDVPPSPPVVGGGSNDRLLLWDAAEGTYAPADYLVDTSLPREFRGPVDPASLPEVLGPVFGDLWRPTA